MGTWPATAMVAECSISVAPRADQSQAEQVALVSINHHARPTGVPVCVELGSHDDIADFHIHCAHPVTCLLGLLSCQSHGSGFGIGT